jgi:hypothetical protein
MTVGTLLDIGGGIRDGIRDGADRLRDGADFFRDRGDRLFDGFRNVGDNLRDNLRDGLRDGLSFGVDLAACAVTLGRRC